LVTGHAGGSIHDITVATLTVPLAILVASQLSRSTLSWVPPRHLPGWLGTHVGQYTALVGPSLAVFFQATDASVLLAVLLIATLLLTPQVLPTRCARPRQLTERTDSCIGGHGGPWCVNTAEAQRSSTLSLSQRRLLNITSTPGPSLARGGVWAGGLVLTPSPVPHSWDATSCREAAPSSSCSTDALVDSAFYLLPLSHWSPALLDVSAGCTLSQAPAPSRTGSG
jgi:hypothetical protein